MGINLSPERRADQSLQRKTPALNNVMWKADTKLQMKLSSPLNHTCDNLHLWDFYNVSDTFQYAVRRNKRLFFWRYIMFHNIYKANTGRGTCCHGTSSL